MIINFLHISDIHCGYDNYTVDNMRESMPAEISDYVNKKGQKIHYIFITGDLRYGPISKTEYPPETIQFIQSIQKKLCVEPCNTFIVPGNHDVTRSFIRDTAIKEIKNQYSSSQGYIEAEYLQALSQTTADFKKIYHEICGRQYEYNHFYIDVGPVNIIHLNTALICGMDNEDGTLILGMSLVKDALRGMDIKKPSIVIAHHGFDCLSTMEQLELERILKSKNVILYLCGHKHVALFSNISVSVKDRPLWQFLCGTNMDKAPNMDSTDMDLFVGMLNTENSTGYIDAYKWSKKGHWMPDSEFSFSENGSTDGRVYFPSKTVCLSLEAINRYLHYLKIICFNITLDGLPVDGYVGSRKVPLNDLYVPISFEKEIIDEEYELLIKLRELSLVSFNDKSDEKKTSRFTSPLQEHPFNSIILAGPGNGKTTYLKRIINYYLNPENTDNEDDFYKAPLMPILIQCRSLNYRYDYSLIKIIEDLPLIAEFPSDLDLKQAFIDTIITKLKKGEIVILIDGLDEITNIKKRSDFINQISIFEKQYPNNRIIITSRIAGYEDYNKSGLSDFEVFRIEPFDDEKIRALCQKWHKAVVNSLEETVSYANRLADVIITQEGVKELATNPLLLTTLLLVQKRIGSLPTRRVALYEESLKVLLETWNQEGHDPMDFLKSRCKLAYIAFSMTVKGEQQIRKDEVIALLYQAREDLSRLLYFDDESPENFLSRTEQRSSILVKAGYTENKNGILQDIYEFQHLSFQEYLTSLAIVNKYYPNAKRTDKTIEVLSDEKGINAFDYASTKEELILLTAALLEWNAEDIVGFLIDRMKEYKDKNIERFDEFSKLSIKLVLDKPVIEVEQIEELLRIPLSNPSRFVLESIDSLCATEYSSIVINILKEEYSVWIHSYPLAISVYINYLDINEEISRELIKQLKICFSSDPTYYIQLSKAVLTYIYDHYTTDKNYLELIEASLLSIDKNNADIIRSLMNTQYSEYILDRINNCSRWIINREEITESMYQLIQSDKLFGKKIERQIGEVYTKSRYKYNELSGAFLRNCEELGLEEGDLRNLFKTSFKTISIEKADLLQDLLRGPYSQIIMDIASEEFSNWINSKESITPALYILTLSHNLDKDGVIDFFKLHKTGDERSVIEAILIVNIYYWYVREQSALAVFHDYMDFLWECIGDTRIAVSHAALEVLSVTIREKLSIYESEKLMTALCKIVDNRYMSRNILYLYTYMPEELQRTTTISDYNKRLIKDVMVNDFDDKLKEGASKMIIIHNCEDL